jgi:hypothetical protein
MTQFGICAEITELGRMMQARRNKRGCDFKIAIYLQNPKTLGTCLFLYTSTAAAGTRPSRRTVASPSLQRDYERA